MRENSLLSLPLHRNSTAGAGDRELVVIAAELKDTGEVKAEGIRKSLNIYASAGFDKDQLYLRKKASRLTLS